LGSSIIVTIFHFSLNLIFHIPTDNFPLGDICHALHRPCSLGSGLIHTPVGYHHVTHVIKCTELLLMVHFRTVVSATVAGWGMN
jgi:hypothetical protein